MCNIVRFEAICNKKKEKNVIRICIRIDDLGITCTSLILQVSFYK